MDQESWQPDRVLLAWGLLLHEPAGAERLEAMRRINGEASLRWLGAVLHAAAAGRPSTAHRLRALALGSVAGDRTRPSMRVYGQSKRELEIGVEALRKELSQAGHGTTLTLAKPGPVRTPMIAGGWMRAIAAPPGPVARRLLAALEAGQQTVYAPAYWGAVMALLRRR
jgi:short-subunit dehydrogenase